MSGVKNQHYVPRFYLKLFTDDSGYLSVVRRDAGGLKPVFRTKPENVCAENYLYEVKRRESVGMDGFIEKGVIEDAFGKIENDLAPAYRSLLSYLDSEKLPKGEECVELITQLAFLLAFFIVRNPKWLNEVRGNAGARSAELLSSGFFSGEDISQMDLAGYGNEFEAIVELAYLDAALCMHRKWRGYKRRTFRRYIKQAIHVKQQDKQIIQRRALIEPEQRKEECDKDPCGFYFPLSPRYAVVFGQRLEEERCVSITRMSSIEVDSFNRILMNGDGLWEFLIARDSSILERLIEEYRDRV